MSFTVKPIDLFDNTTVYDQNKTSLRGKITQKTLSGKQVIGPPIVKYRNTIISPEALTPSEITITENDRVFMITTETNGIVDVALYNLIPSNGTLDYVGKVRVQIPEPPTTTYVVRGFRVVDTGTSGWKMFFLVTASVVAHNGLYMVDNVDLADFSFVPTLLPTATMPSQKAVYKLDNAPFNLANGTGLSIDRVNSKVFVHRGVAATHSFIRFDYSLPITTVGALGATADTFEYETGNLPVLTGTLLLTNSEEFTVPAAGPNAGQPCIIFHTTTTMYRGRVSDFTSGVTSWPSLEFFNNNGNINELVPNTTLRATYSEATQKVILLLSASATAATIVIKDFANDTHDMVTTVLSTDNNEASAKEMYKFKLPAAPIGFDSRNGYVSIISSVVGTRGIYTAAFDVDDVFDLTSIISPVMDVQNEQLFRFTVGFVRQELASPIQAYYRFSGFGSATGGWIAVSPDLDLGGIVSPTGQVQFKINYKVFINDTTNPLQLYSAGVVTRSANQISDFWEYSHDDSTPGNPSRVAFRLKKQYGVSVPNLIFRATDLSDNLYVQSSTTSNAGLFQYSTDGGVNWLALGTIPNAAGTLIRYTFAVPPGIDVRPSIRED